jgi:membrane-associated phospholipid phosphatase
MLKNTAKFVSVVTHPLILLNLGLFSILKFHPYYYSKFYEEQFYTLSIYIAINTLLMPLLSMYLLKRFNLISNYILSNAKQRMVPYAAIMLLLSYTAFQLYKNDFSGLPVQFLIGTILCIAINILVNFKWTISSHAIGCGGLVALYFYLTMNSHLNVFTLFLVSLLLVSGATGWARLTLNAHTPSQLYVGYATGFATCYITLLF